MNTIKLSIIIPAYNEEDRLPDTVKDVYAYMKKQKYDYEIIVVDDGSADKTSELTEKLQKKIKKLKLITFKKNKGKGAAVQAGMMKAKGLFTLFMDADNATPIVEIEKLWPHMINHEVSIGSRHLKDSNVVIKQPWYRIIISRVGNIIIQGLIIKGIVDTQCGFKLFTKKATKEIFPRQKIMRWGFDMEILAIAQKALGYHIKEVPVSWYNSPSSRLRPIRDAWRTFKELVRIKINLMSGAYKSDE